MINPDILTTYYYLLLANICKYAKQQLLLLSIYCNHNSKDNKQLAKPAPNPCVQQVKDKLAALYKQVAIANT